MSATVFRNKVQRCLEPAGIGIQGVRPWDISVSNEAFYIRVLKDGSVGLGEAYMDGWWDCSRLDEFFHRVHRAGLAAPRPAWSNGLDSIKSFFVNPQKPSRAFHIGRHHYDIGNDLFRCMLDKRMIYSCAYWPGAQSLDEAQERKLDLICRKLSLRPDMRLLDIGCGWGGTARYIADHHSARVVGTTVSREQAACAKELCRDLPVDIRLEDYRSTQGAFDRIVSIGMIEHVGYKNYRAYMEKMRSLLKNDGLFLLQTIGNNRSEKGVDPWIAKYIFPNSMLPSAAQICKALEGLFVIEDWHSFGADYDLTIMQWHENCLKKWHLLRENYDERFFRMWQYYLLSCAGAFRARVSQLWQIVLSPEGIPGGYTLQR